MSLIRGRRLGSPSRGLASIEAASVNGYDPDLPKAKRLYIARKLALIGFHSTGIAYKWGGRVQRDPPNGIFVASFPNNAHERLKQLLGTELRSIGAREKSRPDGISVDDINLLVRDRFEQRQQKRLRESMAGLGLDANSPGARRLGPLKDLDRHLSRDPAPSHI